jgi:hypothetical protein
MLKEESLREFENEVLMIMFGCKRDNIAGVWKKLRNEELYKFYLSPSILIIVTMRIR